MAKPLTTTDAEGRYQLAAKRDHYHVVVVAAKGHQVCVQRLQSESTPVRHMPDALMLPGTTLRGRVRDADGKPIAGARVRVEDPLVVNAFVWSWFESQAQSDDKGIFEVAGVPRTGLRVTVSAPGFPAVTRLAAHDSPLDLSLTATGFVRGRVVDADGKPMAKVSVSVASVEHQDGAERIASDDDGRFVVTVPRAARFRVTAHEGKPPHRQFTSGLLRGQVNDVVVTTKAVIGSRRVVLRCVDAATKAPIEQFHASWNSSDRRTAGLALMSHPQNRVAYRDEAQFDVLADLGNKTLGTIIADAPGHGFVVVPVPEDPTEPLIAELPAECFLIGRVLDAETGKPAAGAAVRALDTVKGSFSHGVCPDPWNGGVVTDADGRYRLGGLAPGLYDVQVYGRDRQASRNKRVTVTGPESTLDLEVPKPRYLEFELVGDVPTGCLGTIEWRGAFTSTLDRDSGSMLEAPLPPPPSVPLCGPRVHKLGPVSNQQFRASLCLPTRDRLGSGTTIDLGEVTRTGQRIELPDLRQHVHRGRVQLPPDVPPERVALVANRITERARNDKLARFFKLPSAVCLGSDGTFVIDLPPGRYALQLADLETRLVFHTEDADRELGPDSANTPIEIRPAVRWLDLSFEPTAPGGEVVFSGVSFDVAQPRGELPAVLGAFSGRNNRGQGFWSFRAGTPRVRWLVGAGNLELKASQYSQYLSPASTDRSDKPVDTAVVDVAEAMHAVTLRIPPPPSDEEIVGAAKK